MGKEKLIELLSKEQKEFIKEIGIDLDKADLDQLEDTIFYYMQDNGFENDELNNIGLKCESILDIISAL